MRKIMKIASNNILEKEETNYEKVTASLNNKGCKYFQILGSPYL